MMLNKHTTSNQQCVCSSRRSSLKT